MKQKAVEHVFFKFENDFVEADIRCIPMIVRFKLDACGIKLKLAEWSRMSSLERGRLATAPCEEEAEIAQYRDELQRLILQRTGNTATEIPIPLNPPWCLTHEVPFAIRKRMQVEGFVVSLALWRRLTDLQRFALMKLSSPGHENKNFPRAMVEFGFTASTKASFSPQL
ncbi:MAG TPA: nitrate reductase associated protein [Chryseosolibacter sp.]|nr:nitrate reductase associated protein [Chryseosolibacter sp.]